MAKRKTKQPSKKTTRKKVTRSSKPKANRTATKSTKKAKSSASKSTGSSSVDSVLKKFKKERTTLDTSLITVRKKIEELKAKTRAFEEQIAKLTEKEMVTEASIEQLDARRDAEVSELLTKLGVNIAATSESAMNPSSPFAVLLPAGDDSGEADGEPGTDADSDSDSD